MIQNICDCYGSFSVIHPTAMLVSIKTLTASIERSENANCLFGITKTLLVKRKCPFMGGSASNACGKAFNASLDACR